MTHSAGDGAGPTRLILYAGKGGVGKTTVAAATAVRASELGLDTLVVSTDIAHSLGDVLDASLGSEPRPVADRLCAQEIDALEEVRLTWGKVQDQLVGMLRQEGLSKVQAVELALLPGMEDVASLIQIEKAAESGEFDCIVIDAAPTGETIRLLSMPDTFQWYANRLQGWGARMRRLAGPFLGNALRELGAVDALGQVADRVKRLRALLTNPGRSSYRIVVTPDRMVLREALRAETYLNVFNYPIDAVVVNRVIRAGSPGNAYLDALVARQERTLQEIRDAFPSLPVFEVPLDVEEPIGLGPLSQLALQTFGDRDPTAVMHVGPTQQVEPEGDGLVLRIPLPNVELDRLALSKQADSLFIRVGTFRREIPLPRALAGMKPGTARMRSGMLEIPFSPEDEGPLPSKA